MNWRGGSRERTPGQRKRCSYGTLQNHGHPSFSAPSCWSPGEVRGHVPLWCTWIVLIHSGQIPLFCAGLWPGVWGHHCSPASPLIAQSFPLLQNQSKSKGLFLHICPVLLHDERISLINSSRREDAPNWPTRHSHDGWCLLVASQARAGHHLPPSHQPRAVLPYHPASNWTKPLYPLTNSPDIKIWPQDKVTTLSQTDMIF